MPLLSGSVCARRTDSCLALFCLSGVALATEIVLSIGNRHHSQRCSQVTLAISIPSGVHRSHSSSPFSVVFTGHTRHLHSQRCSQVTLVISIFSGVAILSGDVLCQWSSHDSNVLLLLPRHVLMFVCRGVIAMLEAIVSGVRGITVDYPICPRC